MKRSIPLRSTPSIKMLTGLVLLLIVPLSNAQILSNPIQRLNDNDISAYVVYDETGDGDHDIGYLEVLTPSDRKVLIFRNNGDGSGGVLNRHTETLKDVLLASDLDGDGYTELVGVTSGNVIKAFRDNSVESNLVSQAATSRLLVDFDGDGDDDLILCSSGTVTIYENDGSPFNGLWSQLATTTVVSNTIVAGDLDGDGDADLVAYDTATDVIVAYENTSGDGSTWSSTTVDNTLQNPGFLQLADLDDDGDLDIFATGVASDEIAWFRNDGSWTKITLHSSFDSPNGSVVFDFDSNGYLDVAVSSAAEDSIAFYFGQNGDFNTPVHVNKAVTNPEDLSAADIDGDGLFEVLYKPTSDNDIFAIEVTPTEELVVADNTWTMIGIPYALSTPSDGVPGTLFGDDISEAYGVPNWVMSRYDMTSGDYIRFTEFGQQDGLPPYMAPGYSYWIKHTEGHAVVLDIPSSILDSSQTAGANYNMTAVLPAHNGERNGYAMLANPYNNDYDVDRMRFGSTYIPWDFAINGGDDDQELNANLYTWDGGQYVATTYSSKTLSPWEGFWLIRTAGSSGDLDLRFNVRSEIEPPPPPGGAQGGGESGGGVLAGKINGVPTAEVRNAEPIDVRLMAQTVDGSHLDTYNYAGFRAGTLSGYDAFDAIELNPPGSPFVQLYFSHPDDSVATRLASDYRGGRVMEEVWDMDVRTWGLPNQDIEVSWSELDDIPSDYRIELSWRTDAHQARQPIGYLDEFDRIQFTTSSSAEHIAHFQLRLVYDGLDRLESRVEVATDGVVPAEFGIAGAFPNPFNSTLNVELSLPDNQNVFLTVYDITGRQVGTITDGPMTAGTHTLSWSADGMATGVYFVLAHSALGTDVRKVLLVK